MAAMGGEKHKQKERNRLIHSYMNSIQVSEHTHTYTHSKDTETFRP